jgi:acetolactate synthase-1/3 small subunit
MNKKFTISIFTEDKIGLLNRITIIFTRRHINIQSITASESEIKGVYRYTIVVEVQEDQVKKLIGQIEKQVEVLKAFYHLDEEIISREIALYKISAQALAKSEELILLLNEHQAKIAIANAEYLAIEKTGNEKEIKLLFEKLEPYGMLEFARSGKVAITKPMKTLYTYLKELENKNNSVVKHFN